MSQFPNRVASDEYFYAPQKRTINSFETEEKTKCLSPFGPVSGINCPPSNPACNCPKATLQLLPEGPEPTAEQLAKDKNAADECEYIVAELGSEEWLGIDYSNPYSSYNCNYCYEKGLLPTTSGISYEAVKGQSLDWKPYIPIEKDGQKSYWFNYDKRKVYDGFAYPTTNNSESGANDPSGVCEKVIGDYFKYYQEYSKTSATFWNTPPETPLLRRAQTTLMMAQKIKILVHGNTYIKPGRLVEINYNNFGGRWMVYKVQRILTAQKHSMYLYLMRDGVA